MSSRTERVEGALLVVILLVVGVAAGAASFTHMHDWTMTNSPPSTAGWFGWANAVISELVPVAALLVVRRRRRLGQPIGFPVFVLISAAGLSLAAQLAVAKQGVSGGLLSAVPALAFMGLVKLVLAKPPTVPAPDVVAVHSQPVPTPAVEVPVPRTSRPERPPVVPPGANLLPIVPVLAAPVLAAEVPRPRRPAAKSRAGAAKTDEELLAVLADERQVPRNADGTVPVKRAAKVLGTGPDRARRLLDGAGFRTPAV